MTIKASTVLKNKFWIVEDSGKKVGTLSYNDERYLYTCLLYTSDAADE